MRRAQGLGRRASGLRAEGRDTPKNNYRVKAIHYVLAFTLYFNTMFI